MTNEARITNQTSPTAFQFLYMTLAIDITDGRGLTKEVCRELLLKKSKLGSAVLAICFTLTSCTLLTKWSASKSGHAVRVSEFKFVCVAMCSLVMSLWSRDLPMTSLQYIEYQ